MILLNRIKVREIENDFYWNEINLKAIYNPFLIWDSSNESANYI